MDKTIYVVTSLDVEEEGLFGGNYPRENLSVENVRMLPELAPITDEYGFPLTLFCAHAVFINVMAARVLARMRDQHGAEIGAHLHHWHTPPLDGEAGSGTPVRTHAVPRPLLAERLNTLLRTGADFQGQALTSFRMGRWDLKSALFPLLAELGIKVDSSICPLRVFTDGADHFLAPPEPYWAIPNKLLEAPITQIPISRAFAKFWRKYAGANADAFHFFGALSVNPFWHGLAAMKAAARLHIARGGRVINLFWHSSEMMPGGSPHVPDAVSAAKYRDKIFNFMDWLRSKFAVRGITASQLPELARDLQFPIYARDARRDW